MQDLDLFSTNPGTSGFRLNYLEIYNWGTFNNQVYRIAPQGNNSLLTGANASGKSTLIDALLTLLVPYKKDRFYNQSSGLEKKGARTEETYVLGHYGNIQSEGEVGVKTQQLRDKKNAYSIILASFANNCDKVVTLFQARWFVNGELKCAYGFSSESLCIQTDFNGFDGSKGDWKRTLEKKYNSNVPKKRIEFYETLKDYRDRIISAFGLRSEKALTLFNQVVGVKVLNDLDEFIRNNMLEQRDAESEYTSLNASFSTLIDAKTKIEKVKEQIAQLEPIDTKAKQLEQINITLKKISRNREMALYWFALKNVELAKAYLKKLEVRLKDLNLHLQTLNAQKEKLRGEEQQLLQAIANDDIGQQITELRNGIIEQERTKISRQEKLREYNTVALELGYPADPSADVFAANRQKATEEKEKFKVTLENLGEEQRVAKNEGERLGVAIQENIDTLKQLERNKNNISGREAEIRDMILAAVGATSQDIPFIGELIRVKEEELKWENSIEKILHNFALRLIVPERFYKAVSEFVNNNNLQGRIVFQRFERTVSLDNFQPLLPNCLLNKIEFNQASPYQEWVEAVILDQYNYACVSSLEEFYQYNEKVVTPEGLIKSVHNKHEKDDRQHVRSRTNYVLGWDNKAKIAAIKEQVLQLQEYQRQNLASQRDIATKTETATKTKERLDDLLKLFPRYEDINWSEPAKVIQEKLNKIKELESSNNRLKTLNEQLKQTRASLYELENVTIQSKVGEIYQVEKVDMVEAEQRFDDNTSIIRPIGEKDVSEFERENPDLLDVTYQTIEGRRRNYQTQISQQETSVKEEKHRIEREAASLIHRFKYPSDEVTKRFKDWRSDVHTLPDTESLHLIGEYQTFLMRLQNEDLIRFEKQFDEYLQETVTNKVADFRMFFIKWDKSIKETIEMLNKSLKEIDFTTAPSTYIQLVNTKRIFKDISDFRQELDNAIPNIREINDTIDGKRRHFENKIQPLIEHLSNEQWRQNVMDVRNWYSYKAEEFYKETGTKHKTYEHMGQLSGGEKAQLTYTILGSAIAYQFGLTKEGIQPNSLRFIAIDEAFKAQDEDKARYLITLCKQLHLQLLVVTPSDNIHIVEDDISFVHYVERYGIESRLINLPIVQFKEEREKFLANDNA